MRALSSVFSTTPFTFAGMFGEGSRLTYFGCAVDVLDGENGSEAVQENFSERWYELRCGHQHVYTVTPAGQREEIRR